MIIIGSLEKLEKRFKKRPFDKKLSFEDAQTLLEHYNCEFHNHSGGSHYTITTPNGKFPQSFARPHHNESNLKSYQIKIVNEILNEVKGDE